MLKLPYGIASFESLRKDGYLYLDRTQYIEKIENLNEKYLLFARPRRFGKSLFLDTMATYYDIAQKEAFDELFDGLYIHWKPTPNRSSYLVLKLDFSKINVSGDLKLIQRSFFLSVKSAIILLLKNSTQFLNQTAKAIRTIEKSEFIDEMFSYFLDCLKTANIKLYLFIDEYDNFANELWSKNREGDYQNLITGDGYIKTFFKNLKSYTGASGGIIDRIFVTGVSPLVLDDLTSGANILTNISMSPEFNELPGFTEEEVRNVLREVLKNTAIKADKNESNIESGVENVDSETISEPGEKSEDQILSDIKKHYNGYIFSRKSSRKIYNPSMTLYFLNNFQKTGEYPEEMLDRNVQTDFNKLDYISKIAEEPQKIYEYTMEILKEKYILCQIEDRFKLSDLIKVNSLLSLMYYLGILTIDTVPSAITRLVIPNYVIRKLYWDYLRNKIEEFAGTSLDQHELLKTFDVMHNKGEIKQFTEYTFKNVLKVMSNRDLAPLDEHSLKFYMLALLALDRSYYIYNEIEMNLGYSDIVLRRTSQVAQFIKFNWLIELKYLKSDATVSQINKKINEGKEQIEKYRNDERFYDNLTEGDCTLRSVILLFIGCDEYRIIDCDDNYATFTYKKPDKRRCPTRKGKSADKRKDLTADKSG